MWHGSDAFETFYIEAGQQCLDLFPASINLSLIKLTQNSFFISFIIRCNYLPILYLCLCFSCSYNPPHYQLLGYAKLTSCRHWSILCLRDIVVAVGVHRRPQTGFTAGNSLFLMPRWEIATFKTFTAQQMKSPTGSLNLYTWVLVQCQGSCCVCMREKSKGTKKLCGSHSLTRQLCVITSALKMVSPAYTLSSFHTTIQSGHLLPQPHCASFLSPK